MIKSIGPDPEDDEGIINVADAGRAGTSHAIAEAQKTFETYRVMPHRQRRWLMRHWGDLIKASKDDLAALCTLELGKPFTEFLGSVQYAIDFVDCLKDQWREPSERRFRPPGATIVP